MCRKKNLGTSEHNTCRVQRAACCDAGSTAGTPTGRFGYPEKLRTLRACVPCGTRAALLRARVGTWIELVWRFYDSTNMSFSVSRSCTLSGEGEELMVLALMFPQFLKLSSSLCTQTILHWAEENSAPHKFIIIIRSDNCSKKGKLLVGIPKRLFNHTICNQQKGLKQKDVDLVI